MCPTSPHNRPCRFSQQLARDAEDARQESEADKPKFVECDKNIEKLGAKVQLLANDSELVGRMQAEVAAGNEMLNATYVTELRPVKSQEAMN